MPGAAVYFGALYVIEKLRLEQLAEMRADDDDMAQPYITLKGIKERRMLSWAEERALRRDLVDGARAVLNGQWRRTYAPSRTHEADLPGHTLNTHGWPQL